LEIEKIIRKTAITGSKGDLGWIAPNLIAPGLYEQGYIGTGLWGGSSGIALFYAALYRATSDEMFRQMSLGALAPLQAEVRASRKHRRVGLQLLRDLGATGIGLAYLAIEESASRSSLQRQIGWAIDTSISLPLPASDTLCCGTFSRIALFDRLFERSGDPQFRDHRDILTDIVLRRAVDGIRTVPDVSECIAVPGFFNGLAGMGYELLRIYTDADLPCVHTWD
jgi:lantibiotic modifying enzyme